MSDTRVSFRFEHLTIHVPREQLPAFERDVLRQLPEFLPIPEEKTSQQSFFQRSVSLLGYFAKLPFSACLSRCRNKKTAVTTLLSIYSSLPFVLFSLVMLSGESPSSIGKEWWDGMDLKTKISSVCIAAATLWVCIRWNEKQFPDTIKKLRQNLPLMFESREQFLKNCILLLLSLYSAMTGAGMAYKSFLWTNTINSLFSAFFQLFVIFTRRYPSLSQLFEDIRDLFDKDVQFQKAVVEQLKLLKPDEREFLEKMFSAPIIDEETAANFLNLIYRYSHHAQGEIFRTKTWRESSLQCMEKTSIFLLSLYLAGVAFPTNLQNGFDGANIATTLLFKSPLDALTDISKRMIGFIPGLTAAIFVYDATQNSFNIVRSMKPAIKQNPWIVLTDLAPCIALSATAATTSVAVARNVIHNPNIVFLDQDNSASNPITLSNGIAGTPVFFVSFGSDLMKKVHVPETKIAGLIHFLNKRKLSSKIWQEIKDAKQNPLQLQNPSSLIANSQFSPIRIHRDPVAHPNSILKEIVYR